MSSKTETAAADTDVSTTPTKPRFEAKPKGSWKKIVGMLKGSEVSEDAFRLGAEWRERMNREGR
ncbi:MAG: hypothetical protein JNM99_09780 [Verrucomicrobiaceae bacterium]|nr:hypothetical protein [Verrucomicrobiaceae bacterium]